MTAQQNNMQDAVRVPAQKTYNLLVDTFCDPVFMQRHHVNAAQVNQLRAQLRGLWLHAPYNRWICTYSRTGHNLNERRVLMTFGYCMNHITCLQTLSKRQMAVHLSRQLSTVYPMKLSALISVLSKAISPEIGAIIRQ